MDKEAPICQWTSSEPGGEPYSCLETALPGSTLGFCLFHEPSDSKDSKAFDDGIKTKIARADFDFTGFHFVGHTSFDGQVFDGSVSFREAVFAGDVSFRKARFGGDSIDFRQSKFGVSDPHQQTRFDDARFLGKEVRFDGTLFTGLDASFCGAEFQCAYLSFHGALFETTETTQFLGTRFLGTDKVDFSLAKFSGGSTQFEEAEFRGESTDFVAVKFCGKEVKFCEAKFAAVSTFFDLAVFLSTLTSFRCAAFSGKTSFNDARFESSKTDFSWVKFRGDETLFECAVLCGGTADFAASEFQGEYTSFAQASFECETVFTGSRFSATETDFHWEGMHSLESTRAKVIFEGTIFFPGWTDFSGRNMEGWRFPMARWKKADFSNTRWERKCFRRAVCTDESYAAEAQRADRKKLFKIAEGVCRNIKQSLQMTGDYRLAGEFYFGEMECTRRSERLLSANRFWLWPLKLVCGYGERPIRVLIAWAVVVLVFALGYHYVDICDAHAGKVAVTLWESLYLSCVTFTTLGYGDFYPANAIGQFFSMIEASLGAFLMALFVLVVGRKFLR